MNFKQWLSEWEGFQFNQGKDFTNSAGPYSKIRSKIQTKDTEDEEDEKSAEDMEDTDKPNKLFGFSKNDDMLKPDWKKMKKKMHK